MAQHTDPNTMPEQEQKPASGPGSGPGVKPGAIRGRYKKRQLAPRHEQIRRAAIVKSRVLEYLAQHPGEVSVPMLREALPEVQALGYTNDAFSQQVRTMAVAKLLNMRHSKHDRVNFVSAKYSDPTVIPKFVPAIPLEKLPRTIAEPKLPTRGRPPGVTSRRISATVHPEPLRAAPATGMPLPTASIDIVRSTGRIRIAVGGIAIEVGLVDE